jgi:hypothetical protein
MKASLLIVAGLAVATLSIAPANAAPKYPGTTLATTSGDCSTTTGIVSPVQCTQPYAHSYVECTKMVKERGGDPSAAWWWCTNRGFKN